MNVCVRGCLALAQGEKHCFLCPPHTSPHFLFYFLASPAVSFPSKHSSDILPPFHITGVWFTRHPSNQTVSQGNGVRLGCAVQGLSEPDIVWIKDGEKLYSTDQMFIMLGENHWETFHRSHTYTL